MPKPRPSMMKRQREQAKRDKKAEKAQRREERKNTPGESTPDSEFEYQEPVIN
jgi:hypothetical protein